MDKTPLPPPVYQWHTVTESRDEINGTMLDYTRNGWVPVMMSTCCNDYSTKVTVMFRKEVQPS